MQIFNEVAYAKINLALHVRRRRTDGYHDIETLFAFVDSGDVLTAEVAQDLTLEISGRFAASLCTDDGNLVMKTASLLQRHFAILEGARIHLDKRLPVASGIGGGSADAAATARLLCRMWNIQTDEDELTELLAPLGADIPACVASRTAYGSGTGTDLKRVSDDEISGMPVLLVNPLRPVATAAIFNAWDGIDRGALDGSPALDAAMNGRNDLTPMAIAQCPEIARVLALLRESQGSLVRMSGSGATCFALFDDFARRDAAQRTVPGGWWTMTGALL